MSERTRGTNTGDLDTLLELTHESVRQIAEGSGQSVNLVGVGVDPTVSLNLARWFAR